MLYSKTKNYITWSRIQWVKTIVRKYNLHITANHNKQILKPIHHHMYKSEAYKSW